MLPISIFVGLMLIEIRKIPNGERIFEAETYVADKVVPITLKTQREYSKISCLLNYETEIECECSRCLEKFQHKISGEVRFFIVPESSGNGGFDDEFDCYRYKNENDKIDFVQTLHDDIFTQIPMKPLCCEDCVGIVFKEKPIVGDGENEQWSAALKNLIK
jgi:uncharacterized metal-binding protein YceD (DUF177 family)